MKEKNIRYEVNFEGKEPEFFMKISFESIKDILLSIAHRRFSNRGFGLIRHLGNPNRTRIINGKAIDGVYEENKKDARIFHDSYEEHIERLSLDKGDRDFVMIGNGNLGNNYWHIAWQKNEKPKFYCLKNEPFLEEHRRYSCFIVPKDKKPYIEITRFFGEEDIYNGLHENISDKVDWAISGQQIVKNAKVVPIEEIIEQFYDVKHVFDLRDWGDRKEKDTEIMKKIYEGYPDKFRDNMLTKLREGFPRAKYYHSTLGISEEGIVLYHYYDKIEEIGKRLVDKGVKDSIILDQGGSVGVYASWLNGFLSKSFYFRDNRISTIAFVLK